MSVLGKTIPVTEQPTNVIVVIECKEYGGCWQVSCREDYLSDRTTDQM